MRAFIFLLTLFVSFFVYGNNHKPTLTLAVYLPESPPYMFLDDKKQLTGIAPDILRLFSKQHGYQFDYDLSNRIRAEKSLYDGSTDVSLLAPQWVESPEKLIFSKAIYRNGDRFYSLKPIAASKQNLRNLTNKTVCTREFFKYPVLDEYVAKQIVRRMNVSSEQHQLKMLKSKRCDTAYLNEWVAGHLLKHNFNELTVYQSDEIFDQVDGIFAFGSKHNQLVKTFNQFAEQIATNGQLNNIINKYTR